MAEYIERDVAIDHVYDCCLESKSCNLNCIKDIPAADVAPVRHGRWLSMDSEKVIAMDDDGCPVDSCRCSECGDWLTGSDEYMVRGRYCPNCGALMDKDGDGE